MKPLLRLSTPFGSALLIALAISGCGGGSGASSSVPTPIPTTATFAYLQDTTTGSYPGVPAYSQASAMRKASTHVAMPRISALVNIVAGTQDAYLVNAATASRTKLNSVSGDYRDIDLSLDGTKVVFTAWDSAGYSQIFVADVSNFNNPSQLTSNDTLDHFNARFSLDGATVLSTIDQNQALSLSMIPTAGGTETVIRPSGLLKCWSPSLTLDHTTLVFEGQESSNVNAAIYSINVDGSSLTRLTNPSGSYWDWRVSLSPDGTKMLFTRYLGSGGANNIYVVGIGGESATVGATQLTTDGYSWDSIYLAGYVVFVSSKDNQGLTGNNNIYGMNVDGSNVVRLTNTALEDAFDLSAI